MFNIPYYLVSCFTLFIRTLFTIALLSTPTEHAFGAISLQIYRLPTLMAPSP